MNKPSMLRLVAPALVAALGLAPAALAQPGAKQMAPPRIVKTIAMDLGPEIEGMQGRQLRMRFVQVDPGAGHAEHNHKGRPEVAYVVQGTITETRAGKANQLRPGDTWTAGKDTTHALQNNGTEPAMVVVVDVLKPQ